MPHQVARSETRAKPHRAAYFLARAGAQGLKGQVHMSCELESQTWKNRYRTWLSENPLLFHGKLVVPEPRGLPSARGVLGVRINRPPSHRCTAEKSDGFSTVRLSSFGEGGREEVWGRRKRRTSSFFRQRREAKHIDQAEGNQHDYLKVNLSVLTCFDLIGQESVAFGLHFLIPKARTGHHKIL